MLESDDELQPAQHHSQLQQALIIGLSLLIGFGLIACPLSAIGVHQRLLPPPAFAVRLGPVVFAAPCPPQMSVCDESTPFYALWHGVEQPNGSMRYHYLFFIYLAPERPARRP